MYLVKSGKLEILRRNEEEKEVQIATFGPGDFLGEMALIDEGVRSATRREVQDSEVLLFSIELFLNLSKQTQRQPLNFYLRLLRFCQKD